MNWPREIAEKIVNERPNEEVYTVASGISPSGFVHIGNFREIATPYLIAEELKKMGKKVRYILSFDEFDRFRKVPGNIDPNYEKYIGMPYTELPCPFDGKEESYAAYMENYFLNEIKQMGVEVECIYQSKEYQSGRYIDYIKLAMQKRNEIFDIIDEFRTQDATEEEKESYYPISIYCSKCHKDTTRILSYDDQTFDIDYECDCGHKETINLETYTHVKLQWKVDWPMRWKVENVTFESGGMDHSADNGSKAVATKVAKQIFDFDAPVYFGYNFIGIKGGDGKMSSSRGHVLTLSDLLNVYDKNIIWWFYAKYRPNSTFDIALDNDVIRFYSEFDRWVKAYFEGTIDDKNKEIIASTNVTKDYLNNPSFNYLATFLPMVNNDEKLLKVLLSKENIDTENSNYKERLERAKFWVNNYGADYQVKLVNEPNIEYYNALTDMEKEWLSKTKELLTKEYSNSDEFQTDLYAVVKEYYSDPDELKTHQKRYFQIIYNLLLNSDRGPKMGLFLMALPKDEIISKLCLDK